jgi:acyl-lipid omega-3 desaturase
MSQELKLQDIQNKIPKECFEKSLTTSVYYFARDFLIMGVLYFLYPYINNIFLKIIWWNVVGFFMWAIFVIGHDCGHGSFSNSEFINNIFGHIAHTSILVPYHGWRLSHRNHHLHHNDIEKDKAFGYWDEDLYKKSNFFVKNFRYTLFNTRFSYLVLFMYPPFLTIGEEGNHFNPFNRKLYQTTDEFIQGIISNIFILGWVSFLLFKFPIMTIIDAYIIPNIIFVLK